MSNPEIYREIKKAASTGTDPSGESYRFLSLHATRRLSKDNGIAIRQIEITALENAVIPERYHRNIGTIGIAGQIQLLKSTAGILGAGGLGGFAIELLARMGIGKLVVIDQDVFDESNLNRQLMATEENMKLSKTEEAAARIRTVNSAVEITRYQCRGDQGNLPEMLDGCNVVLDCLDNLPSRFALEEACQQLKIIMVHGAIAGFLGQLAVIRPGRPILASIYGTGKNSGPEKGIEVKLGNPAVSPAMLASWQVSEAVKILTGLDGILEADLLLIIDMQAGESYRVELSV